MTKWLTVLAVTGCTGTSRPLDKPHVTYEADIWFPDDSSISIDGVPISPNQVMTYDFASFDALLDWRATADVVTPDAAFEVQMKPSHNITTTCELDADLITLVREDWELDGGPGQGPVMLWTGEGKAYTSDGSGCGWEY